MQHPIRTIVAGVASLDRGDPALGPSLALAARLGAALHLVHAFTVSPDSLLAYERAGAPPEVSPLELYHAGLVGRLRGLVHALTGRTDVECHALLLPPSQALARVAEEVGACLVVVGDARRVTPSGTVLGTTAERLFHTVRAPVLVARGRLPARPRVLVAAEAGAPAHRDGVEAARWLSAEAAVLRTAWVTSDGEGGDEAIPALERVLAEGGGSEPRERMGEAAGEIVAEAAEWDADLLVLGTGAAPARPGSVAGAVLRSALCSVLVLPPAVVEAAGEPGGAAAGGVVEEQVIVQPGG